MNAICRLRLCCTMIVLLMVEYTTYVAAQPRVIQQGNYNFTLYAASADEFASVQPDNFTAIFIPD